MSIKGDKCPNCGSDDTISNGYRYNRYRTVRKMLCKKCGCTHTLQDEQHVHKKTPADIREDAIIQSHYMSLRDVADYVMARYGIKISPSIVWIWKTAYGAANPATGAADTKVKK